MYPPLCLTSQSGSGCYTATPESIVGIHPSTKFFLFRKLAPIPHISSPVPDILIRKWVWCCHTRMYSGYTPFYQLIFSDTFWPLFEYIFLNTSFFEYYWALQYTDNTNILIRTLKKRPTRTPEPGPAQPGCGWLWL